MPILSNTLNKTIQAIQNTAMKCIFKLNYLTSTEEVTRISSLPTIIERSHLLNERYLKICIKFENPLIRKYEFLLDFNLIIWQVIFLTVQFFFSALDPIETPNETFSTIGFVIFE